MNRRCLVAVLALCCCSATRAQAPPLEAFAELPAMESPSISPDGKRLAFISQAEGGSFVLVLDLATNAVTSAVDTSAFKPRSVNWANTDTLLLLASETITLPFVGRQIESFAPYGVDLSRELNIRQLLRREASRSGQFIGGPLLVQGAQLIGYQRSTGLVLFPRSDDEGKRVLYAVDAKNDRRSEIDQGTRFTRGWVVNENGEPLFRVEYTQKTDYFRILARRDKNWTTIAAETIEIPELSLYGLNADGDLVAGMRPKNVGREGLYILSQDTGKIERPFFVHDRLDVAGARIDPYTNRVIGSGVVGESPVWFDAELARHQKDLDEAFPGEDPTIVSWSQDRTRFILGTDRADRAPAYYLYDAKALTAKALASTNPALDRGKLPARTAYSFKARDGVEIPGYLTRPLDAVGPTPLVLLPHGGPAARDVPGFDWLAQALATRGYAVLQPNFRGSGGFGAAWEEAGYGQWGVGVMQHDLSDGVAALIAAGIADPELVCIAGASYGGYAALAGATFTPELYRCAASIAGVSDLRKMLIFEGDAVAGSASATVSYWRRAMGVEDNDDSNERLSAASPADHVDRVRAPVLLIHGRDDTVVPLEQSRIMERALTAASKPVEFVELVGEDHWLSGPTTRLATLKALDAFLAKYLKE